MPSYKKQGVRGGRQRETRGKGDSDPAAGKMKTLSEAGCHGRYVPKRKKNLLSLHSVHTVAYGVPQTRTQWGKTTAGGGEVHQRKIREAHATFQ